MGRVPAYHIQSPGCDPQYHTEAGMLVHACNSSPGKWRQEALMVICSYNLELASSVPAWHDKGHRRQR